MTGAVKVLVRVGQPSSQRIFSTSPSTTSPSSPSSPVSHSVRGGGLAATASAAAGYGSSQLIQTICLLSCAVRRRAHQEYQPEEPGSKRTKGTDRFVPFVRECGARG